MKQKSKIVQKKKINKTNAAKLDLSFLAHSRHTILRHFRLIKGEHTGKLIHHRHTSHALLVVILLILGLLLYASGCFASAKSVEIRQTVSVTATVPETAPTVGEAITPNNSNIINKNLAIWFETPVPLYLIILALTLGFWGGDIFDRKFGVSKYRRKLRKTS